MPSLRDRVGGIKWDLVKIQQVNPTAGRQQLELPQVRSAILKSPSYKVNA